MKLDRGISLVSLVITIVVMVIIAAVGIATASNAIKGAQKTKFETELKIIHTRVNELSEEKSIDDLNELGNAISNEILENVNKALEGRSSNGFRFFEKADLEAIGIYNVDRSVIINFSTREVVDIFGFEDDGRKVYRLDNWNNISYNARNSEDERLKPTFSISKKNYGLNATILVENIEFKGDIGKGTVSYQKAGGVWKQITGTEIPISVTGTYNVKVTDESGISSDEVAVDVALTNKPKLDSGMVPVVYVDAVGGQEGYWKISDENSGEWYDYASDKAMWANVMLLDGLTVEGEEEGENISVTSSNKTSLVGKKVTTLGSMFVWIPRYMYQIPTANYHTNTEGEIQIKFLKGTTNVPTDDINVKISNASGGDNWNVHPAFCDGNKNDYANGEWDKDITGIWVAKFEASSSNPSASNGGGDTASLNVKVLPSVTSWRGISTNNIFEVCRNMVNSGNIYGLSSNSDTHMMKNSEWGMVAYLAKSKYGQVRSGTDGQVWNNPSSEFITGSAGTGRSDKDTSSKLTVDAYDTGNGQKASTTGTIYGIYDMAGGAWERTAAYVKTVGNEGTTYANYNTNITSLRTAAESTNGEKKYVETYEIGTTDTQENNYKALYNSTNERTLKWGDAIYETSASWTGSNSWQSDSSSFPSTTTPVFIHGGVCSSGTSAGLFCFSSNLGNADSEVSFRPVCVVQ